MTQPRPASAAMPWCCCCRAASARPANCSARSPICTAGSRSRCERRKVVENRVAAADRLQVALLKVDEVGQAGGTFQFPLGKLSLKLRESRILAFELLVLGSGRFFTCEKQEETSVFRRVARAGPVGSDWSICGRVAHKSRSRVGPQFRSRGRLSRRLAPWPFFGLAARRRRRFHPWPESAFKAMILAADGQDLLRSRGLRASA
jgi:hypothetical protein